MQYIIRMGSKSTNSREIADDQRPRKGCRAHIRLFALGVLLIALAGCGAHVTDLSASVDNGPAPSEILVRVVPSQEGTVSDEVAGKIQSAVVDRLTEAHVTAEPYVAGTRHPGAAVLQISVVQADSGNFLERFIIGFGMGEAKLAVRADLIPADRLAVPPVLAFDASANSGIQPGLVLPGAVALGTGGLIGLAIGGAIDVAGNIHGGLDRPERSTAKAIVTQLKDYYATAGWQWPAA